MSVILELDLVDKSLPLPQYHTEGSAGFDLYIRHDILLIPKECKYYPSNVRLKLPKGYYAEVKSRSSTFKREILVFNGVIDSDYTDEISIGLQNLSNVDKVIEKGTRVAQLIIHKYERLVLVPTDMTNTLCQHKGFGSTGT